MDALVGWLAVFIFFGLFCFFRLLIRISAKGWQATVFTNGGCFGCGSREIAHVAPNGDLRTVAYKEEEDPSE